MGNESTTCVPAISFSPEHTLLSHLNHPVYGDLKLYRNKNFYFALKSWVYQDEPQFQKAVEKFKASQFYDIPSLVKILNVEQQESNQLCSNHYKLYITLEFFQKTLATELASAPKPLEDRNDSQVLNLIESVLSALIFLDFKQKHLVSLSPNQIFSSPEGYKLVDQ